MKAHDTIGRLSDDASDATDELRTLLASSSLDEPSSEELRRLTARLAAILPPGSMPSPTSAPAAGAPSGAGATGTVAKVGLAGKLGFAGKLGLAVVAIGIGGGVALRARLETAVATPSPSVVPATPSAPSSSSVPSLDTSKSPEPPASTIPAPIPAPSASTVPIDPARPIGDPSPPLEPEAAVLSRAHHELLAGSPDKALAIVTDDAKRRRHGALTQEREVIAIESLVKLGRMDEARSRVATFEATYPSSSHRDRLRTLVH